MLKIWNAIERFIRALNNFSATIETVNQNTQDKLGITIIDQDGNAQPTTPTTLESKPVNRLSAPAPVNGKKKVASRN